MNYEIIRDFSAQKIKINIYKLEYCFRVKPLNNITYPGMKISKVILLQPEFAKNVILKKVKRKVDLYLTFLATDDDDGSSEFILDDLIKFKNLIFIKYSKYLSKKELTKLLREVSFIESKLKMKLYQYDKDAGFGKSR